MQQQPHPDATPAPQPRPQPRPERITQLQCLDSNTEFGLFFTQALSEGFKYMPGVLAKIYNQLELLVGLAEYRLTVAVDSPHPGDLLQNIRYKRLDARVRVLYFVLTVVLPYVKKKLYGYVMQDPTGWKQHVLRGLGIIDKILLALHLVNLSIFIKNGQYRTVTQRLLKIPMQFINGQSARVLNFTLMNRKMIWHIYELFLKTFLPFANNILGSTLRNIFYLNSYLDVQEDKAKDCQFCEDKARLPVRTNCGHLACYYCYSTNVGADQEGNVDKVNCKNCGESVTEWKKLYQN